MHRSPRCRRPPSRSGGATTLSEANHLAWLERPFTEGLRALEERGGG
jgi:hypothetical protein